MPQTVIFVVNLLRTAVRRLDCSSRISDVIESYLCYHCATFFERKKAQVQCAFNSIIFNAYTNGSSSSKGAGWLNE